MRNGNTITRFVPGLMVGCLYTFSDRGNYVPLSYKEEGRCILGGQSQEGKEKEGRNEKARK